MEIQETTRSKPWLNTGEPMNSKIIMHLMMCQDMNIMIQAKATAQCNTLTTRQVNKTKGMEVTTVAIITLTWWPISANDSGYR
jgi:hypothetical protein